MLPALPSALLFVALFFQWSSLLVAAQSQQSFFPAAVPLAVRSPYLSAWMSTTGGTNPSQTWPLLWNTKRILGWTGYIRVDNSTFEWLGRAGNASIVENIEVTPTRTIFTIIAGPMNVTVTYLSPIEPSDLVLQSFPFAYMAVNATSRDGLPHSVQVYSDISGEWASGDNKSRIVWSLNTTSSSVFHSVHRSAPESMTEINNIAEDSQVFLGMANHPLLTWQAGTDIDPRRVFASNGRLVNTQDNNFRPINLKDWPIFAISVDLGAVTSLEPPVAWGIGLVRDPTIQVIFGGEGQDGFRSSYFRTKYSDLQDGIDAFLNDYPNAYQRAVDLDERLLGEASKVSSDYADLISLATRQTLGGLEISTARPLNGSFNASDVQIFIKDIGSNAQTARSSPVEVVYAALPMLLYLNSSWAGYTLAPLLEYQNANGSLFANPDLGRTFPVVSAGPSTDDKRAVDDSSSMLIMVYAHALFSGDGSLIGQYYPLLRRWADYLTNHTMNPKNQMTDGTAGDTSVNLMLKGIIAIQAMAGMSQALGDTQASKSYSDTSKNFISQWSTSAKAGDGHLMWDVNNPASWGLVYNLFADKLIQSNLVEQEVYDSQAAFYGKQVEASQAPFGLPLSSDSTLARSDWTMFAAGTVSDLTIRNSLISMLRSRANSNGTAGPFPVAYDINSGVISSGMSSPAQGAMYSLMALSLQPKNITIPPAPGGSQATNQPSSPGGLTGGAVAGIVIGALAAILLPVLAFLLCRKRRRDLQSQLPERQIQPFTQVDSPTNMPIPLPPMTYFPPIASSMSTRQLAQMELQMKEREMETQASGVRSSRTSLLSPTPTRGHRDGPSPPSEDSQSQGPSETEQLRSALDEMRRELTWMRDRVEPPPHY